MAVPWIPIALGGSALLLILLAGGDAGAHEGTDSGGRKHPPTGTVATIAVTTGEPSLLMHIEPFQDSPVVPPPAPQAGGLQGLVNGSTVTVVRSNVPDKQLGDKATDRWWEVTAADGRRGFIRVVGPQGEWNVTYPGQQTFRAAMMPTARVAGLGWSQYAPPRRSPFYPPNRYPPRY